MTDKVDKLVEMFRLFFTDKEKQAFIDNLKCPSCTNALKMTDDDITFLICEDTSHYEGILIYRDGMMRRYSLVED